ncbi:MAG: redoxin domain-containing protein [Fuerstiella sp.]|nr:redoxin domain-containing protein [Fuerstiella sp.]
MCSLLPIRLRRIQRGKGIRLSAGSQAPQIVLSKIDGAVFDTNTLHGRAYMLSIFRFSGCPFCNLRPHTLVSQCHEDPHGFTVVAVFDSPVDKLKAHTKRHQAPLPFLADESNEYYRKYGIEHSLPEVAKGLSMRLPELIKAALMRFIPFRVKGQMTTMPADVLVRPDGTIHTAHYGNDEGDHLPLNEVQGFAQAGDPTSGCPEA